MDDKQLIESMKLTAHFKRSQFYFELIALLLVKFNVMINKPL